MTPERELLRAIIEWLGQQQGRKGVWLAAVDDFRARAAVLCRNASGGCWCGMHLTPVDKWEVPK